MATSTLSRTAARRALLLAAACAVASADSLWPEPAQITATAPGACVSFDATKLTFAMTGYTSDVLISGISRYTAILQSTVPSVAPANCTVSASFATVNINVASPSLDLSLNTSEAYTLTVPAAGGAVTLTADSAFGALRGLETFSQLIDWRSDRVGTPDQWVVPVVTITDAPVFKHRGALVDSARHFLPVTALLQFLDAMAYNKMNVLHWHIVDDQSFPWVSASLPNLSALGAWGAPDPFNVASHTYSPKDVQNVIAYARLRGIRVLPEFDTPGHSLCWGNSTPGLLTQCYNTTTGQPIPGSFGPIDPTSNVTWEFLPTLFKEVTTVFPDSYVHIGGDEVSYACWASNPSINAWMAANGYAPGDYESLEGYYVQRVLDLMHSLGRSYMGWQEIFDNGLRLEDDTVVGVWKYHNTGAMGPGLAQAQAHAQARGKPIPTGTVNKGRKSNKGATTTSGTTVTATPTWEEELFNVTAAGYRAVVSSPWYLNYISYGMDWPQYWTADLLTFGGNASQEALVMGGEMAMWGEYVDNANLIARSWPRASAVAESLWSNPGADGDLVDAEHRMLAHRCRMLNRGLSAEPPNGPAWCPQEWQPAYNPPWAA